MTTATMAVTEGMYQVDPSQEGFPPQYESHNLVLKQITLDKKWYYVLIGKAVVTNYTPEIVFPEFNIFHPKSLQYYRFFASFTFTVVSIHFGFIIHNSLLTVPDKRNSNGMVSSQEHTK
jgi:hypothetical protein